MTLGDPPTTSPTISGRIQFFWLTFIFVRWVFIFFTLSIQYFVCYRKLIDMVSKDLVGLCHMVYCCHHQVHMDLVRGCVHFYVIHHRADVLGRDHSVFAVIYRLFYAQLLGDLDAVIFSAKILNPIHVC